MDTVDNMVSIDAFDTRVSMDAVDAMASMDTDWIFTQADKII